ncbi:Meiosis protein MEI2 [Aspergillus sclerotialis]|uniref:Meiosis protein MEI2 n=1 Tax=Aspergillus sclerotialis TaxID=2070753 RepID=A0A3A2ZE90_9EURO|nr:Meiosis protein MEI2 [Aspergillus sclerotialis]
MMPHGSSRMMSSPSSVNDQFSPNGSPDTRLTAFSPEDGPSKGRLGSSLTTPFMESRFRNIYPASSDPFLTPVGSSSRARLDATAASFTPVSGSRNVSGRSQPQRLAFDPVSPTREAANTDNPISVNHGQEVVQYVSQRVPNEPSFGNGQLVLANMPPRIDDERRSRSFIIERVPFDFPCVGLSTLFNRREFSTIKGPVLGELRSMGKVYVAFGDSREAQKAREKVHLEHPDWHVVPLTAREYAQLAEPSLLHLTSDYEGQVLVIAFNTGLNRNTVAHLVESTIVGFGDIKSFRPLRTPQDNSCEFLVEFYNSQAADNAVVALKGASVDGCTLQVLPYKPAESRAYAQSAAISPVNEERSHYEPPSHPRVLRTPQTELSPTGRSRVPSGEYAGLMDWMARSGERIRPSPQREASRYPEFRLANQNAVDVERIRLGLDVRTTIMLRNIPNKIDQSILKAIVDQTSHGKYDFMYLRIDFANNCNVGYAFINFDDPIDIIDFVNARAGRTWNCFNSDKIAEVSYATIQGKDCLVQKFRNSSVMLENPMFRPKIFHTGTGPLAGTEARFPGPDNASKMRRSLENAEHVGLFPPRSNQQYRDEQRRRRSLFDRESSASGRDIYYTRPILTLRHPTDVNNRPAGDNNPLRSAPGTYPRREVWYDATITERGPNTA